MMVTSQIMFIETRCVYGGGNITLFASQKYVDDCFHIF